MLVRELHSMRALPLVYSCAQSQIDQHYALTPVSDPQLRLMFTIQVHELRFWFGMCMATARWRSDTPRTA